jgi:hypothetical protein
MSAPLLRLLLEVLPCLLLGVLLEWRWPKLSRQLSPPLIRYGVPLSLLGMLLRSGLERSMFWAGLLALVGIGGGLALLRWLPGLRQLLPPATLRLGAVAGNTAYFGFPVVMALLPPAAMGAAVAYDLAATLLIWGLGPAQGRWLVVLLLSLPLALVAAQQIRAVPLVLLLLAPLLAWIVLRFRPVGRAGRRAAGVIQRPTEMANGAAVITSETTGAAGGAIKAAARVQSTRPEPLELPTALWTLATYLSLGWLPSLLGGL